MATNSCFSWSVPLLVSILICASVPAAPSPAPKAYGGKGLVASYLRCEYLIDPLGVGETAPRLSWIVESGERGQKQTAYRILVSSSEALLKYERGDLWDSGQVASSETTGTPYEGKPRRPFNAVSGR
jgi:alpha-L-rhamnosidase